MDANWTSASTPPTEEGEYLVVYEVYGGWFRGVATFSAGKWFLGGSTTLARVVFWTTMPEAPTRKGDAPLPTDVASARVFQAQQFDRILGLPRIMVGPNARRWVYANQAFWQQADDATVAKLLASVPPG